MKSTNKSNRTSFTRSVWSAVLVTTLLAVPPAFADDGRGHDETAGGAVVRWQELYWRWAFGDVTLPADRNGNAVSGNVVMMPYPNTPGDGTPGHQDVTLEAGQSWLMPLWTLRGTDYTDGTPPNFGGDYSEFHNSWTVTVLPHSHH